MDCNEGLGGGWGWGSCVPRRGRDAESLHPPPSLGAPGDPLPTPRGTALTWLRAGLPACPCTPFGHRLLVSMPPTPLLRLRGRPSCHQGRLLPEVTENAALGPAGPPRGCTDR